MSDIPADLRYTKEHEWAKQSEEVLRIGITAYAVEQLGDITMVELPMEGDEVSRDEEFGSIESVKAVSALYAPVSGEIVALNEALEDAPEAVNDSPYVDGWLLEIKPSNPGEFAELMDKAAYEDFIAAEEE